MKVARCERITTAHTQLHTNLISKVEALYLANGLPRLLPVRPAILKAGDGTSHHQPVGQCNQNQLPTLEPMQTLPRNISFDYAMQQ